MNLALTSKQGPGIGRREYGQHHDGDNSARESHWKIYETVLQDNELKQG